MLWLSNTFYGYPWPPHYSLAAIIIALLFYFIGEVLGIYRSWRLGPGFWASLLVLVGWRSAVRGVLRTSRAQGRNTRQVAIAGAGGLARQIEQTLSNSPWMGMKLMAVFDDKRAAADELAEDPESACPYGGNFDALVAEAQSGALDVIYITLPRTPRI